MFGTRNSVRTSAKIMEPLCGYKPTCYSAPVVCREVKMEIIFCTSKFNVVCFH